MLENSFSSGSFLQKATGKLTYRLTNDYLFRAVLQNSNTALKGLLCALLHLAPESVTSAQITNPIILGQSIDNKNFYLDVRVTLNHDTDILIEMQILNKGNWPERSLEYLCRSFDNLSKGQDYAQVRPVIQISILDFTLFPDNPEFYATYMFMNRKNHKIYTDKVRLSVLDLKQIEMATDEDISYQIHYWAKLFKAATWEEIKMLVKENEALEQAAETAYVLSADEQIRLQCEAREEYFREQRYVQRRLEHLEDVEKELQQKEESLRQTNEKLQQQGEKLQQQGEKLQQQDEKLQQQNEKLQQQDEKLQQQGEKLQQQGEELQKKDKQIQELFQRIELLKSQLKE